MDTPLSNSKACQSRPLKVSAVPRLRPGHCCDGGGCTNELERPDPHSGFAGPDAMVKYAQDRGWTYLRSVPTRPYRVLIFG